MEADWWINIKISKFVKDTWADILLLWFAIVNSGNYSDVLKFLKN